MTMIGIDKMNNNNVLCFFEEATILDVASNLFDNVYNIGISKDGYSSIELYTKHGIYRIEIYQRFDRFTISELVKKPIEYWHPIFNGGF